MNYLTSLSKPYRWLHISILASAIILGILIISQSVVIAEIIDAVLLKQSKLTFSLTVWIIVILILRSVFRSLINILGWSMADKVKHSLRLQLTQDKRKPAETLTLSSEGIEGIDSFYSSYLPTVYRAAIVPLLIVAFLLYFHHNAAFIMLITAPFIPIFYIIIGINTEKKAVDQMTALTQFSNYFLDTILGMPTIKLFGFEAKVIEQIKEKSQQFKDKTMIILKTAFLSTLMLEFIAMLSIGIIALEIGLGLIVFHTIDFYTALVVLMLAPEFYNALKDLGFAFHTGKQATGFVELLKKDEDTNIQCNHEVREDIMVDFNVEYPHFNMNINRCIPITDMVIFGPSGSGKSTFAKAMIGLQEGQGNVRLPLHLKDNVVYLSQEPFVISGTVRENVTMLQTVDEERLNEVALKVGMKKRIESLPDGYETIIGHGGIQLSGGEMHRLMLMRCLLNPKQLIIFDEPTAMLDIDTRNLIYRVMEELSAASTIWTIAHQRTTIRKAKYLLLIENGSIAQMGTPESFEAQPFYQAVIS